MPNAVSGICSCDSRQVAFAVTGLTLLLGLAAATVLLAPMAERINLPYPVVMLMFGLALAFVPGMPSPTVNAELILPLVLPPLLFAAARRTSWRQFLDNRRAIGLLAIAPPTLVPRLTVFALAIVIGYYVIGNVHHALHTPLMSVTNAISGIIVVGGLVQVGRGDDTVTAVATVAILLASINVFGGFAVTRRMLAMFSRS